MRTLAGFILALLWALAITLPCFGDDLEREIRALRPADTSAAENAVLDNLQQRARRALAQLQHLRTAQEVERSRPRLRQQLRRSLGFDLLPSLSEKIGFFEDTAEGHGFQKRKREAAYGWMLRWLAGKGDGAAFAEPETVVMPVESSELRCFPSGGNQAAGPGIIEAARRLAAGAPHAKPAASLQEFLAWPSPAPVATSLMRDVRSQRLTIKSESGLELPAFLLRPSGDIRGVLIAIDDEGKEELASALPVREMFSKNWAVVGVDPRGIGELKTSQMGWVAAVKHSDINNCA